MCKDRRGLAADSHRPRDPVVLYVLYRLKASQSQGMQQ